MKRITIVFADDTIELMDDWRRKQKKIPTYNQTVNRFVKGMLVLINLNQLPPGAIEKLKEEVLTK